MEVIETQPEIDYVKIGQRIRAARLEKGVVGKCPLCGADVVQRKSKSGVDT